MPPAAGCDHAPDGARGRGQAPRHDDAPNVSDLVVVRALSARVAALEAECDMLREQLRTYRDIARRVVCGRDKTEVYRAVDQLTRMV